MITFEKKKFFVPQNPVIWLIFPKISKISNTNFKKRLSSASSACETKNFFIFEKSKMRRYHSTPQVQKSDENSWKTRVLKKVVKRGGSKNGTSDSHQTPPPLGRESYNLAEKKSSDPLPLLNN